MGEGSRLHVPGGSARVYPRQLESHRGHVGAEEKLFHGSQVRDRWQTTLDWEGWCGSGLASFIPADGHEKSMMLCYTRGTVVVYTGGLR